MTRLRLTASDTKSVENNRYRRNLDRCVDGFRNCDPLALTPKDAAIVRKDAQAWNFDICMKTEPLPDAPLSLSRSTQNASSCGAPA